MTRTLRHLWRTGCGVVAVALAAAVLPAASAGASTASDLSALRQATAAYHDLSAANDAHYVQFLPCFDLPGVGGMGQHFADLGALDGTVDPLHPEVLVYEPRDGGYKLVAVEFVVPATAWSSQDPPRLYGQDFHFNDSLGVWALHAWIWRPNPLGMFADFNPNVRMCP